MSHDRVFEIKCGCCGSTIHVDPRTRSVYFTQKKGESAKSFEDRVNKAKSGVESKKVDQFQDKLQDSGPDEAALDRLFKDAKKKAEEDPNERPPSIWDYE